MNKIDTDDAAIKIIATLHAEDNEEPVCFLVEKDVIAVALTNPDGSRILRITDGSAKTLWSGGGGTFPTALCRFQGAQDDIPRLYATVAKPDGGVVLRETPDGGFMPVSAPGFGVGANWLGPMTVWDGALVVATGTSSPQDVTATPLEAPWLMASVDPAVGKWDAIAEAGFGDDENHALCALAMVDGVLYAGTSSLVRGFQLWSRTSGGTWQLLLINGAVRYSRNQRISAISGGNGEVLIGTGYRTTAPDDEEEAVPIGPELLSLDLESGQWEIIVGQPRFSNQGLKVPAALMGPGFDVGETADLVSIACAGDTILAITVRRSRQKGEFGIGDSEGARLWQSDDFGESFMEVPVPSPLLCAAAPMQGGMHLASAGTSPSLLAWTAT